MSRYLFLCFLILLLNYVNYVISIDAEANENERFGFFVIQNPHINKCIRPGLEPTYRPQFVDCDDDDDNIIWKISLNDGPVSFEMYKPDKKFGDKVCINYNTTLSTPIIDLCNDYSKFINNDDGQIVSAMNETLCFGKLESEEYKLGLNNCEIKDDQIWEIIPVVFDKKKIIEKKMRNKKMKIKNHL